MKGRSRTKLLLACTAAWFATQAMAAPIFFIERWENHISGEFPLSPWYVDPCMPDGGLRVLAGAIYNHTYDGNKGLIVNFPGFNGIDAGVQARLVPNGQLVLPIDATKLILEYRAKGEIANQSEWYLELAQGDVHAPRLLDIGPYNPLPEPIPVIAFCKPWASLEERHKACYIFDGRQWWSYGYLENSNEWIYYIVKIDAGTVRFEYGGRNNPPTLPRQHLGGFDRISIYTRDCIYQSYTAIDDIKIYGGNVAYMLDISPNQPFVSIGPEGGAFLPECKTYTLSNISLNTIEWTVSKNANWLDVAPAGGTLLPGESIEVTACVNANANAMALGLHTDALVFQDVTHSLSQNRNVELYVGQIDSFTEVFTNNNDLDHQSVMLSPDGAPHYYRACSVAADRLPTPPIGGYDVPVTGNSAVKVTLAGGAEVQLYGNSYPEFYVGANGYITFGDADTSSSGTAFDHFKKPRISGLFMDLAPTIGQVTYKQLFDRVAVTWQNVVRAGSSEANTFQVEMFYDGRIRMTWLDLASTGGLVGLSKGFGVPTNFNSSDFSEYAGCPAPGYPADFDGDGDIDQEDFGYLQACLVGLLPTFEMNPDCADADLDLNSVLDGADVQIFQTCYSGPNIAPPDICLGFGSNP